LSQGWQRKVEREHGLVRALVQIERARLYAWEKSALNKLDFVVSHCEKDGELLREMNPFACICPIRAWFTAPANAFSDDKEPGSIVFFGAFDRSENREAVKYAVREILPLVRAQYPRFKFYIAGNQSERLSRLIEGLSDVVLTGFIEDVPRFLSRMQVALLPLRTGAGVKIKTLECMAAGLSVVATPVGVEGVGGESGVHYFVGTTPRELADHTVRLLNQPRMSRAIGQSAKEFVFEEFDFERALGNLCSLIENRLAVAQKSLETVPQHCSRS
jgi:glycosyltransferase involved in cell wall biosynthesis